MISPVEMGGRSSCQRHFYQWIINHYIHPGNICGSITTYPPMIHWISAGFLWRLSPFGFHCLWWASHSFFCNIANELPWQLERNSKKRPTGASWKFMIVTSFFKTLRIGKGYSPPDHCSPISTDQRTGLLNAGQAFFSYPTYLEVFSKMWFVLDVLWTKKMGWGRIL